MRRILLAVLIFVTPAHSQPLTEEQQVELKALKQKLAEERVLHVICTTYEKYPMMHSWQKQRWTENTTHKFYRCRSI